ncbi:hypothetical protein Trydic_g7256 [Trypoxylus dichotomus]
MDQGAKMTKEDVIYMVKTVKNNTGTGPDGIPTEVIKLIGNEHIEDIIQEALADRTAPGLKVNGEVLNIIYADDTVLSAEFLLGLQCLIDRVVENSEDKRLTLNIMKTKFMIIAKLQQQQQLWIKEESVKKVSRYKYLGTTVNESNEYTEEITAKIG